MFLHVEFLWLVITRSIVWNRNNIDCLTYIGFKYKVDKTILTISTPSLLCHWLCCSFSYTVFSDPAILRGPVISWYSRVYRELWPLLSCYPASRRTTKTVDWFVASIPAVHRWCNCQLSTSLHFKAIFYSWITEKMSHKVARGTKEV